MNRDEIKDIKEHLKKIDINVYVDDMYYKDSFLWDILDENICPEQFAYTICEEMGLSHLFA